MMDILKSQLAGAMTNEEKLNATREFLQLLILKIIYDNGYFKNLTFTGDTALRILYKIKRFSEDLDFSLASKGRYRLKSLAKTLQLNLEQNGFLLDITARKVKTVEALELRFRELLYPLGLIPLKNQKLMIKLEIDTNPPKGSKTELSLVNEMTFVFTVTHFDLPSLYATKLHACFYRAYAKGRDFYDLIWYLGKKTVPNFAVLNNAIKQTQGKDPNINEANWKEFLLNRLKKVDFNAAKKDLERFLMDKSELRLFDAETIGQIVKSAHNT